MILQPKLNGVLYRYCNFDCLYRLYICQLFDCKCQRCWGKHQFFVQKVDTCCQKLFIWL